jgi:pulcherriminic acid synthase
MTTSIPAPPDLLSPEHIADPWPGMAVLRDHYPVHQDETLGLWLVSRYADIRPLAPIPSGAHAQDFLGQYLADAVAFFGMDGADHRQRRALLAPVFARAGVESFSAQVEKHARALLEPIFERERAAIAAGERTRAEMDFVTEFTNSFSANVMIQILDLPITDASQMHEWFSAWIDCEGNVNNDQKIIDRALKAKKEFTELIQPIIKERRTGDGDDLVTRLCQAELDGLSLTDQEVQSFVATMFLAGGETTDHQLGWVMHELSIQPEVQQAMIDDPSLVTNVLAESMRYHSIIPFGQRVVPAGGVEVEGVKIEEGELIATMWASGNRDPRRFENPDEFDIYRSDLDMGKAFTGAAEHLSFGGGAHFCIGSHLTKAEMETALNVFFEHARDVRAADGFEAVANPESPFVRALANLPITFDVV